MRKMLGQVAIGAVMVVGFAAAARADVCVAVDEARDMLVPADRAAAVLLLGRQFEANGEHVVAPGCADVYTVSHVVLGQTIFVTLTGARGQRDGRALGLDDLPPLYSQMVRSLVTGKPMSGFNVVDRTNVTVAQSSAERVQAESQWYARLGYGGVFGDRFYGGPAVGFGYRFELDSFGVDVSFLNFQSKQSDAYSSYSNYNGAFAGSALKLEGLYFFNPKANRSTYVGGGFSWGGADFGNNWHGDGLQGELTAGHELFRASTLRTFVQADATIPFYQVSANYYPPDPRRLTPVTTVHRYAPSLTLSIGFGWQRERHPHP